MPPCARLLPLCVAAGLAGALACAEARPPAARDSAPAGTTIAQTPDAAFRARLGVTWELMRVGDREIPAPSTRSRPPAPGRHPGPGSRPTIRFTNASADELSGRPGTTHGAGGWSFCNGYGTAYALGPGDTLRFHGFQSTLVGCGGPDSLEDRYFRALAATRRFELHPDSLILLDADGTRLVFVVARDSTGG